jgi:hypothetical protein
MFRKEDLPSGKKGGKAKMLFVWMVCRKDLLRNNCATTPTIARRGSGKLAGEKRAWQPKKVFPQTSVYISFLSTTRRTLLQLCKRHTGTTLLFLMVNHRCLDLLLPVAGMANRGDPSSERRSGTQSSQSVLCLAMLLWSVILVKGNSGFGDLG